MKTKLVGMAIQILVMAIVISIIFLFIGIGILVFVHVCVLGRRLRRNLNGDDDVERRERRNNEGSGLSNDDLEKLPCYYYATRGTERSVSECAVCLEMFEDGDKCRMLPQCKHSFHVDCVDSWLLRAAICPTCRASVDICVGKGGVELEEISQVVDNRGEH